MTIYEFLKKKSLIASAEFRGLSRRRQLWNSSRVQDGQECLIAIETNIKSLSENFDESRYDLIEDTNFQGSYGSIRLLRSKWRRRSKVDIFFFKQTREPGRRTDTLKKVALKWAQGNKTPKLLANEGLVYNKEILKKIDEQIDCNDVDEETLKELKERRQLVGDTLLILQVHCILLHY